MSGIVAAAQSSGCCCRPQEGCLCTNENRPGAVTDRSFTSILVSCDVNYAQEFRFNGGSFNGFCGSPCRCAPVNTSGWSDWGFEGGNLYRYAVTGNRVYQDLDKQCLGCTTTSCPACHAESVNGSLSSAALRRVTFPGDPLYYEFWSLSMSSLTEQSIGVWTWTPTRPGYCVDPDRHPYRIRRFCNNPLYQLGGGTEGVLPQVVIDPNGQYIRADNAEYANGRWGSNIGAIYLMYSIHVLAPSLARCYYEARVNLHFMSFANIRDTVADCGNGQLPMDIPGTINGFGCGGSQVASWTYRKPCASPSDSVLGTYERVGEADQDSYTQAPEDRCGRSQFYVDVRASAGDTLTIG